LEDNETRCFCLTVDDGWIESLPDCVEHGSLGSDNEAPVARCGSGDYWVRPGDEVPLDGEGSFDPDGDELTFSWTQTCGEPAVELEGADEAAASFTAPVVECGVSADLCLTLTVDDQREAVTCEVSVHVEHGTDSCVCGPDRDEDGVTNACDNCPQTPNPDQADADDDGQGDACEEGVVAEGEGEGEGGGEGAGEPSEDDSRSRSVGCGCGVAGARRPSWLLRR